MDSRPGFAIAWLAAATGIILGAFGVRASDAEDQPANFAEHDQSVSIDPADPIAGKPHWAFRPLTPHQPPEVASNWPETPIDHYIFAKLEAAGLQPAPDADRTALVRRLYVQLLGLPPTPEQVQAFSDDRMPGALSRLVDQLLASPQFGEHWGRHWLDLARYADSNGLDENFLFREAWRYRNWVIDAINADMPYDRFLLEQIAGDLLPYQSIEQRDRQRIAAGFLVVGPKVLLGIKPDKRRMQVADEQIDTIGRAVLGQTLGCARCHDHKFDPVPAADYYALAGILTSTRVMEERYMLGQRRVMEQLVGLGAEGEQQDDAYEAEWLARIEKQKTRSQAEAALELLKKNDAQGVATIAKKRSNAVAAEALAEQSSQEQRIEAQQALLAELKAALDKTPEIPPRAMVPSDVETPADEPIRIAGEFDVKGEPVARGVLSVLSPGPLEIAAERSGRLELAAWLTDVQRGAGNLTARVYANRVWQHLIGEGLVRTVDNFGRTGEAPTHPQLLDYLAEELIASGWSLKHLVRQVVLSRTFAQSNRYDAHAYEVDPENRLLWRAHRRRIDAESLRDAMLLAAGTLDLQPMESTVWYLGDQATAVGANKNRRRTDFPCRSVYLPVIRNDLPELFQVMNFADPHCTTGRRPTSIVATQGLYFLNDPAVMAAADATARRLLGEVPASDAHRVDRMFKLLCSRAPDEAERAAILAYVARTEADLADAGVDRPMEGAWAVACHALFSSSRFQFLE